uniref:Uncharacterized protein n=1 Tax=viral metagenome TaxID=1070528 RepID=A0A6C0CVJ9_9ZZZZ
MDSLELLSYTIKILKDIIVLMRNPLNEEHRRRITYDCMRRIEQLSKIKTEVEDRVLSECLISPLVLDQ